MARRPNVFEPSPEPFRVRIDKWLWRARFFKSRSLATQFVARGKVRINRERTRKAGRELRAGDVLTFMLHRNVRVVRVLAPGERRGPAAEARQLYEDLSDTPEHPATGPESS